MLFTVFFIMDPLKYKYICMNITIAGDYSAIAAVSKFVDVLHC